MTNTSITTLSTTSQLPFQPANNAIQVITDTDRLSSPYQNESERVKTLLNQLPTTLNWQQVVDLASPWVEAIRDNPPPFWAMESLLKEFPIQSHEGLALMRLAEALLRVPDNHTAIALTADQLGKADFDGGDAMLTHISAKAIALSKTLLPSQANADAPYSLLTRLGANTVVAATMRAIELLGTQFVLAQTIDKALNKANHTSQHQDLLHYSYDMLGEGARTDADALKYLQQYATALQHIAQHAQSDQAQQNDGISIKLSALYPRYEHAQWQDVLDTLVPRVWNLCEQAAKANMNLTIDAEEVERLELSLAVFEALLTRVATQYPHWQGFGLAIQAYQTRAVELITHVQALAQRYGIQLMCRLVKGAYWDSEIKRAQELGMPYYPVFTHKHHTDLSYLVCAHTLLSKPDLIYPQFATHNAASIAAIIQLGKLHNAPFELQRLHGMGEAVYQVVNKTYKVPVRVYAPVGQYRDLLAYLVRRLLENGANSSFVNQLCSPEIAISDLLASPIVRTAQHQTSANITLPTQLFAPDRRNSMGLDLAQSATKQLLTNAYNTCAVPNVPLFDITQPKAIANVFARSRTAYQTWATTTVDHRASILEAAADLYEAQCPQLCALLVKEAHKTWGDALAEVREAIDFLRYYAQQARGIMQPITLPGPTGEQNTLYLKPRGVWVCISPWNFPLAIFVGQIAAALVTGNCVLAKPAEQTPGIAHTAIKLLHQAGIPVDVLTLLHGPGETVGAALVACPGVAGVVFTGSSSVAKTIQRQLAMQDGPIVPFIAETGGINAMVVDSTALPEQVVDTVVQSAFRSAGQRCSALRLLCVHSTIADTVIEMLHGAVALLKVGNPADFAIDIGPVIDQDAYQSIQSHIAQLQRSAKPLWPSNTQVGTMPNSINPVAFELDCVAQLKQEIFGPVLHIVRWDGSPNAVIDQINALGYGLTLGIHSRIDSRTLRLAAQAHIGNVYINRNMIGAVVGVQPFGGEGLSGTGPKAGGPHYLYRFCAEQTITINTTAAGGNVALMQYGG